jgi:hypothetical protein
MESVILEQSMTTIIHLLAVALGFAGSKTIATNINHEGEFELNQTGKKTSVIICTI